MALVYESIQTLSDERLDVFMRLTEVQLRSRLEPEKGIFIAESDKVIERALSAGFVPLSFLIPEHKRELFHSLAERFAVLRSAETNIPVFVAPAKEIEALTGYELTRGVLGAFQRPPLLSLRELVTSAHRVAVLENITNHTNIGAIFRSAAALGIDAVILNQGCCDPWYRRAIRVSMGTVFQVPWTRIGRPYEEMQWPEEVCAQLSAWGFATYALALKDQSLSLDDAQLKRPSKRAFVFGTEGEGLSEQTIKACDFVVKIPMNHGVDSLNVAAASAVTFWELR